LDLSIKEDVKAAHVTMEMAFLAEARMIM